VKAVERLRKLADDPEKLDETYEEWERGALRALQQLHSAGQAVRKVPIDIDALLSWCRSRSRPLDGAARAQSVVHLLRSGQQSPAPEK
jgi:hypothetical protein